MSVDEVKDPRIDGIKTKIRVVPDFPKKGIMFQDITTLLLDPKAFKDTIDLFVERYRDMNISVVAGGSVPAGFGSDEASEEGDPADFGWPRGKRIFGDSLDVGNYGWFMMMRRMI
ncbi:unnamed protein product [Microthlaspi erraticum]|uniref:adenine phosphoribosyltransferase n=1 Tax=Microthlaspi erraticum TaxID=1685480 RepID=A0A6D2KQ04_9BRAS|nr:unnamed protein product [Microthlaspi erraticum]